MFEVKGYKISMQHRSYLYNQWLTDSLLFKKMLRKGETIVSRSSYVAHKLEFEDYLYYVLSGEHQRDFKQLYYIQNLMFGDEVIGKTAHDITNYNI